MTRFACLTIVVAAIGVSGCADMKAPWGRKTAGKPTAADIYANRQEELAHLAKSAAEMDTTQQDQAAGELLRELAAEENPVMRMAMVRALGAMRSPGAFAALEQALRDTDKDVRIRACEAVAARGDAVAARKLSEVVASDTEVDVRLAAARGLGQINDPQAVAGLGLALADPDPALQRRAIESLRNVTDRDFGNSVPAWREFVAGGSPPEVRPTLAERMRRLF